MAKLEKCDGCGKTSPDNEGLWLSNHWVEVVVRDRIASLNVFYRNKEYLFCKECLSGETQANKASTGLGLLIEKIGKAMGLRPSQ